MADVLIDGSPIWPELHPFASPSAREYSRWRLDDGDTSWAAIPLGSRSGGVLLALPAAFRSTAELEDAESTGFVGLLGPFQLVDLPLQGAAQRSLGTTASVLVIDLEILEMDLEALYPMDERSAEGPLPFSEARGRTYWPHPSGVRTLLEGFVQVHGAPALAGVEPLPGAERATPYQTADELEGDGEAFDADTDVGGPLGAPPPAAEALRGPPARRGPPSLPLRAAAPTPKAAGAPAPLQDEGAPITRAEVVAEMRSLLAAQAAILGRGDAASLGPAAAAPTGRLEVPQLFTDEMTRLGLADSGLAAILAQAPAAPQRVPARAKGPASSLVAAWAQARPPAGPPPSARAAVPGTVPPPPGLGPLDWADGFAEGGGGIASDQLPTGQQSELSLALLCLHQSLQRGQGGRLASHPLVGSLHDHAQPSASAASEFGSAQMRGIARRREWQQVLLQHGPAVQALMKENLARVLGITLEEVTPMAMYQYFREHSPLGAQPSSHELLTHMAWLSAELWRASEEGSPERVQTLLSCQCMFIDQLAGDRGYHEAAWFLTGLEPPPCRVTRQHTEREAQSPFSPLVDPRWLSAQGEYVKELQGFRTRLDAERAAAHPKQTPKLPPREPKQPRGPKASPKGGRGSGAPKE